MTNANDQFEDLSPMLAVPNVAETVRYYEEKLGFDVDFVMDEPTLPQYGVVYRDNYSIHFIQGDVHSAPGAKGGINIVVQDVDALYRNLKDREAFSHQFPTAYDAIREHPPEDKPYGMRDLIMVDPNGYIIVFGHPLASEQ